MDTAPHLSCEDNFRLHLDGLFAAVQKTLHHEVWGWWGSILELRPMPEREWEIVRQRNQQTGFCHFDIKAERLSCILRITWERYPNGQYMVQVIDNEAGFEVWNRSPTIIPPEIEIEPGTYVWRMGNLRGNVLTFTENQLTLACVCQDGLISWERRGRYQMVGRRLHLTSIEERELEWTPDGRVFSAWRKVPDKVCPIKKLSETEFELCLYNEYRHFQCVPLLRGDKGYFLHESQVALGRVVPPRLWLA